MDYSRDNPTNLSLMKIDHIEIIARAAALLADADGVRGGSTAVTTHLARVLSARIAFVALRRGDGDIADIIAAHGLGAADFRRLETRLVKSGLWKILNGSSPFVIDNMADDAVLNFISFGTGARMLAAVPVMLHGSTI